MNSPLPCTEKLFILPSHALGLTTTEIGHSTNRSESTIRSLIIKFKTSGQFKLKSGHPSKDRSDVHDTIVQEDENKKKKRKFNFKF
jgi:hypothetical protein